MGRVRITRESKLLEDEAPKPASGKKGNAVKRHPKGQGPLGESPEDIFQRYLHCTCSEEEITLFNELTDPPNAAVLESVKTWVQAKLDEDFAQKKFASGPLTTFAEDIGLVVPELDNSKAASELGSEAAPSVASADDHGLKRAQGDDEVSPPQRAKVNKPKSNKVKAGQGKATKVNLLAKARGKAKGARRGVSEEPEEVVAHAKAKAKGRGKRNASEPATGKLRAEPKARRPHGRSPKAKRPKAAVGSESDSGKPLASQPSSSPEPALKHKKTGQSEDSAQEEVSQESSDAEMGSAAFATQPNPKGADQPQGIRVVPRENDDRKPKPPCPNQRPWDPLLERFRKANEEERKVLSRKHGGQLRTLLTAAMAVYCDCLDCCRVSTMSACFEQINVLLPHWNGLKTEVCTSVFTFLALEEPLDNVGDLVSILFELVNPYSVKQPDLARICDTFRALVPNPPPRLLAVINKYCGDVGADKNDTQSASPSPEDPSKTKKQAPKPKGRGRTQESSADDSDDADGDVPSAEDAPSRGSDGSVEIPPRKQARQPRGPTVTPALPPNADDALSRASDGSVDDGPSSGEEIPPHKQARKPRGPTVTRAPQPTADDSGNGRGHVPPLAPPRVVRIRPTVAQSLPAGDEGGGGEASSVSEREESHSIDGEPRPAAPPTPALAPPPPLPPPAGPKYKRGGQYYSLPPNGVKNNTAYFYDVGKLSDEMRAQLLAHGFVEDAGNLMAWPKNKPLPTRKLPAQHAAPLGKYMTDKLPTLQARKAEWDQRAVGARFDEQHQAYVEAEGKEPAVVAESYRKALDASSTPRLVLSLETGRQMVLAKNRDLETALWREATQSEEELDEANDARNTWVNDHKNIFLRAQQLPMLFWLCLDLDYRLKQALVLLGVALKHPDLFTHEYRLEHCPAFLQAKLGERR